MPIRFKKSGTVRRLYASPFVGPIDYTVGIQVNLAVLTAFEVDAQGYLKPGIPLRRDGTLVTAGGYVFGTTVEEVKVADNNLPATIAALGVQEIAVATICQVNESVASEVLGREYTAAERAGFIAAGSKNVLLSTAG